METTKPPMLVWKKTNGKTRVAGPFRIRETGNITSEWRFAVEISQEPFGYILIDKTKTLWGATNIAQKMANSIHMNTGA